MDEKLKMSEVFIDDKIVTKYKAGDIVIKRVRTLPAAELYERYKRVGKIGSIADFLNIAFRNSANYEYVRDLSSDTLLYSTANFNELGYIQKVVKEGNWLPEYDIDWEFREENKNYAGTKMAYHSTYGQELLIGLKHVKILTPDELIADMILSIEPSTSNGSTFNR